MLCLFARSLENKAVRDEPKIPVKLRQALMPSMIEQVALLGDKTASVYSKEGLWFESRAFIEAQRSCATDGRTRILYEEKNSKNATLHGDVTESMDAHVALVFYASREASICVPVDR